MRVARTRELSRLYGWRINEIKHGSFLLHNQSKRLDISFNPRIHQNNTYFMQYRRLI